MCLNIKEGTTQMVAKKDIPVYKCFSLHYANRMDRLFSPCHGREYRTGEFVIDNLGRENDLVQKGLHSYVSRSRAEACTFSYSNRAIYRCIIPKGSQYYLGDEEDIVSDRLVVGKYNLCKRGKSGLKRIGGSV